MTQMPLQVAGGKQMRQLLAALLAACVAATCAVEQDELVPVTADEIEDAEVMAEMLDEGGLWVEMTVPTTVERDSQIAPRNFWRRGTGQAFLVRLNQAATLVEMCPSECDEYDEVNYDFVRSRSVEAGEEVFVSTHATVYARDTYGYLLKRVYAPWSHVYCASYEQLNDPEWSPAKIDREFKSVADLRRYAEQNRKWMVIASPAAAPLFGWSNPDFPVYSLRQDGHDLIVFALKREEVPVYFSPATLEGWFVPLYRYGTSDTCSNLLGQSGVQSGEMFVFGFPKDVGANDTVAPVMGFLQDDGATIVDYERHIIDGFTLATMQ